MPLLPKKLSTRKRKFVESYAVSLNATQAAIDAGYSKNTAHNAGYRLVNKDDVQESIAIKLQEVGLTKARTLREIAHVAYSRTGELFDESGNLRPIHKLPEHLQAAISSVKVIKKNVTSGDGKTDDIHEVKLWDKVKALELAGKYLDLFQEKEEPNVTIQISWGSSEEPEVRNITPEAKYLTPQDIDVKGDT